VIVVGEEELKATATTVARRGRGIFQQKNICDQFLPGVPHNHEVIVVGEEELKATATTTFFFYCSSGSENFPLLTLLFKRKRELSGEV